MKQVIKSAKNAQDAIKLAMIELGVQNLEDVIVEILDEGSKGFLGIGGKEAKVSVTLKNYEEVTFDSASSYKTTSNFSSESTAKSSSKANSTNTAIDSKTKVSTDSSEKAIKDLGSDIDNTLGTSNDLVTISSDDASRIINLANEFTTNLLSKMGLNADVSSRIEGQNLVVEISNGDMAVIIGKHGQTLDSIQYLLSIVVNKGRSEYIRVNLDIENYREKRKESLEALADRLAARVRKTKKSMLLEPMNPYERRIIHAHLHSVYGVGTKSEGQEPYRRVVIFYDARRRSGRVHH